MTKAERNAALWKARVNADLGNRAGLWRALQALMEDDGPQQSGWASLGVDADRNGNTYRAIFLKYRKEIATGWKVPTLILDATAKPELLEYIWPGIEQTADVQVHAPYQRIVQVRDNSFALSRLDIEGAKDDAERRHRERNMRQLHGIICREARRYMPERMLVVAQVRIKDALLDIGNLPGNIELANHNGVRGRDEWGNVRALVVSGRTLPPSTAIARMTEALTGIAMPEQTYKPQPAWHEMANGAPQACEALSYPDPIGEALRWQCCEAEVFQIIGRARGVNRSTNNPVDVLVLTDLPLPLPVELIPMSALELSPADRMLAAGGVVLDNAGDAAAAYPDLWENRIAAKQAFLRAKGRLDTFPYKRDTNTGMSPTSLVQVRYRRKGPGRSEAAAWFDPGIVPRNLILRWLTDRLGELAFHEVQAAKADPSGGDGDPSPIQGADPLAAMYVATSDADEIEVLSHAQMSDADKLAMRARLQDGHVADPDGAAPEVVGGYGELLDPGAVFGCRPSYPHPPGPRWWPLMPYGVAVVLVLAQRAA